MVRPLAALAAVLLAALAAAPSAPARAVTGKVTSVNDGDTIDVDVAGDGTGRSVRVRFAALQATELIAYNRRSRRGRCHAVEATEWLERHLRRHRNRVRLTSADPAARASNNRLLRFVAVRSGGRWRDVGRRLLAAGHAFWMPAIEERGHNAAYRRAQQTAHRRGAGVWDGDHCGRGPQQHVPIEVRVNFDARLTDGDDVNGEWVEVRNLGAEPLRLGGWTLRNSRMRRFVFPAGTTVAAGATARLHVGRGTARPGLFFWGLTDQTFINPTQTRPDLGDAAILMDPDEDLRAAMLYPCVVACRDPRQGALAVAAQPRGRESVTVRNVSAAAVDLDGLQLVLAHSAYTFQAPTVLAPGRSLVVEMQGDARDDTAVRRHWGFAGYALPDAGGTAAIATFDRTPIACDAWGGGACTR